MSDKSVKYDEDFDNPFDLMDEFGGCVCEQEDYDEECEIDGDWDYDIKLASIWIFESSLGNWARFASAYIGDDLCDFSDQPEFDELSVDDHIRLVMKMRKAERLDAAQS